MHCGSIYHRNPSHVMLKDCTLDLALKLRLDFRLDLCLGFVELYHIIQLEAKNN